jgi:hypothetical protein
VAEHGHNNPDIYAVLNEQRRGGVAAVMDSNISHIRLSEDVLSPPSRRVDRWDFRPIS